MADQYTNPYYGYGQQYVPEGYEVKSKYDWKMPAIGAGLAFAGSIPQLIEAQRLKRERERLLKEGAPGLSDIEQEQIANARSRAASSLAPGYAQEMEGIAQQQGDVIAAGKRGVATPSNLMNLLSRLNIQGQAARRNLAIRGAQEQRRAQGDLMNVSMSADARRENRMRRWEDDLAAMDAARRQYATAPFMAPLQGAMAFMPYQGIQFGKKGGGPQGQAGGSPFKSYAEMPSQFSEQEPMFNPYAGQKNTMMTQPPTGAGASEIPLNRPPSMMRVPEYETEQQFVPNPQYMNPVMNTTMRRTYRPSRLPNTMMIESPIRPPYTRFE